MLDATFREASERTEARRVAGESWADRDELRCTAPAAMIEDRLSRRAFEPGGASDASVAVARAMQSGDWFWPSATTVDTSRPLESVREIVLRSLGVRLDPV